MKRLIGLLAFCALSVSTLSTSASEDFRFLQIYFPCNEDEVLTYDPRFGFDHTGCILHEELEQRALDKAASGLPVGFYR